MREIVSKIIQYSNKTKDIIVPFSKKVLKKAKGLYKDFYDKKGNEEIKIENESLTKEYLEGVLNLQKKAQEIKDILKALPPESKKDKQDILLSAEYKGFLEDYSKLYGKTVASNELKKIEELNRINVGYYKNLGKYQSYFHPRVFFTLVLVGFIGFVIEQFVQLRDMYYSLLDKLQDKISESLNTNLELCTKLIDFQHNVYSGSKIDINEFNKQIKSIQVEIIKIKEIKQTIENIEVKIELIKNKPFSCIFASLFKECNELIERQKSDIDIILMRYKTNKYLSKAAMHIALDNFEDAEKYINKIIDPSFECCKKSLFQWIGEVLKELLLCDSKHPDSEITKIFNKVMHDNYQENERLSYIERNSIDAFAKESLNKKFYGKFYSKNPNATLSNFDTSAISRAWRLRGSIYHKKGEKLNEALNQKQRRINKLGDEQFLKLHDTIQKLINDKKESIKQEKISCMISLIIKPANSYALNNYGLTLMYDADQLDKEIKSCALSKYNGDEANELKNLLSDKPSLKVQTLLKIQAINPEDNNYKEILFEHDEIKSIQDELAKINTEQAKKLSKNLKEIEKDENDIRTIKEEASLKRQEADSMFKKSIFIFPSKEIAINNKADNLMKQGKLKEALLEINKVFKINKESNLAKLTKLEILIKIIIEECVINKVGNDFKFNNVKEKHLKAICEILNDEQFKDFIETRNYYQELYNELKVASKILDEQCSRKKCSN